MPLEILTPRLILRVPVMDDAAMIVEAMQPVWHDLQLWMSWAYDGANTVESVQKNFIANAAKDYSLIGLCRETGRFVIATGANPDTERPGILETGYWVSQDFLGKGYATEATNAACRFGFDELGAKEIHTRYYEGNDKSRRVMEKLGFHPTERLPKGKACCLDGTLLDVHEYAMTDPSVLPPLDVSWKF